jgi:peptidoglycan/LPS O-acetylase OafA/YrhL
MNIWRRKRTWRWWLGLVPVLAALALTASFAYVLSTETWWGDALFLGLVAVGAIGGIRSMSALREEDSKPSDRKEEI